MTEEELIADFWDRELPAFIGREVLNELVNDIWHEFKYHKTLERYDLFNSIIKAANAIKVSTRKVPSTYSLEPIQDITEVKV